MFMQIKSGFLWCAKFEARLYTTIYYVDQMRTNGAHIFTYRFRGACALIIDTFIRLELTEVLDSFTAPQLFVFAWQMVKLITEMNINYSLAVSEC